MKRIILFFSLLLIMLQSCSVVQNFHFNKDFSGQYEVEIDMSQLITFAIMFDTTGAVDAEKMMAEIALSFDSLDVIGKYNELEGISNAYAGVNGQKLLISYDYTDIESLNKAYTELGEILDSTSGTMGEGMGMGFGGFDIGNSNSGQKTFFTLEKKKLSFTMSEGNPLEMGTEDVEIEGMEGVDPEEMMSGMAEMFDISTNFTFDRKVKKVETKGMGIRVQEKNKVEAFLDMENIKMTEPIKISFKLK